MPNNKIFVAIVKRNNTPTPSALFLQMVALYVVLLSFSVGFDSILFKSAASLLAILIFLVILVNAVFIGRYERPYRHLTLGIQLCAGLLMLYVGLGFNILTTARHTDIGEWTKIVMAPAFLPFGYIFAAYDKNEVWKSGFNRLLFALLFLLPLGLWLIQLAIGKTSFGAGNIVGLFANRNNAALYFLALISFYGAITGREIKNIFIFLFAGVAFGTLGVSLAIIVSLIVAVGQRRYWHWAVITLSTFAIAVIYLPNDVALARIRTVIESMRLILTGNINLSTIAYGELVTKLGTSDLSFVFRIKHWMNIISIHLSGDISRILFGNGVGSSINLSEAHLIPHNDYVRLLFECGVVSLVGFGTILVAALLGIGRRWATVPLLAISIYFFSENIVNNFVAMVLLFYSLGATLYRSRSEVDGGIITISKN